MSAPRTGGRRRSAANEIAELASRAGADDALETLVGQFADPQPCQLPAGGLHRGYSSRLLAGNRRRQFS